MLRLAMLATMVFLGASVGAAQTSAPADQAPATAPAPAAATPTPATAAAARTADRSSPDRLICEEEETLGTRLGRHRVCKTKAQWAQERQEMREVIRRRQDNYGCTGAQC